MEFETANVRERGIAKDKPQVLVSEPHNDTRDRDVIQLALLGKKQQLNVRCDRALSAPLKSRSLGS